MKPIRWIALAVLVVVVGYPVWLGYQVWSQSHRDELPFRAADAIVVLGAAQYNGRPSPIFRARLDQGLYLFEQGYADTLFVTGGKRPGDAFTEAATGATYLIKEGVPAEAIVTEARGRTTLASLRQVEDLAEEHGVDSLMVVSDPLHSERIKRIAYDLGFDPVYASPASYVGLRRSRETKLKELVREVGSLLVYEFLDR